MTIRLSVITCWYKNISMANYSNNLISGLKSYPFLSVKVISSNCYCLPKLAGSKEVWENKTCELANFPPYFYFQPKNRLGKLLYDKIIQVSFNLLRGMIFLSKCKPCDIIHYQQSSFYSFGIFPLIPIMLIPTSAKKIITVHSLHRTVSPILSNLLYHRANRIIVHSEEMRKFLVSKGIDTAKIRTIPHGVSIPKLLSKERDKITFFGSPSEPKGAYVLLEALRKLKERKEKTMIHFYGIYSSSEKDSLDAKAKELCVDDCVIWGGRLSEYEFDEKMQESMFTFAVYKVPVSGSNVVIRAMANATPIIAARIGGIPEYLRNLGVLIDPNDPEALADAISELIKNPMLRNEMGTLAREQALQFSWKIVARENLKVYLDVLRKRN